jgi:hypothetical protein
MWVVYGIDIRRPDTFSLHALTLLHVTRYMQMESKAGNLREPLQH